MIASKFLGRYNYEQAQKLLNKPEQQPFKGAPLPLNLQQPLHSKAKSMKSFLMITLD